MFKHLIIGQAPGPKKIHTMDRGPIMGQTGRRLAGLLETPFHIYELEYERVNLIDLHIGKSGKGDLFDDVQAAVNAEHLKANKDRFAHYSGVILLGPRVAKAFKLDGGRPPIYFVKPFFSCSQCLVIPHPSGVNRWYNQEHNRQSAITMLRRFKWPTRP